tara:strand:- start:4124 stop:4831 length:708 start_codon:yes stop_codon:yes gene_type:complete
MSRKPSSDLGRWEYAVQALIFIAVVQMSVETIPGLGEPAYRFLFWLEQVVLVLFTIEYIVRLVRADNWRKYAFSFFGIIDLLAILPSWIGLGFDSRIIRSFRTLRLLRVLKLVRYNEAIQRYHRALIIAKDELILFGMAAGIVLFLTGSGIYYFENQAQPETFSSIPESLWWALITLTTVGYGDAYPITVGGKIFTFFVVTVGLGIVAVPTALLASALSQARNEELEARKESEGG